MLYSQQMMFREYAGRLSDTVDFSTRHEEDTYMHDWAAAVNLSRAVNYGSTYYCHVLSVLIACVVDDKEVNIQLLVLQRRKTLWCQLNFWPDLERSFKWASCANFPMQQQLEMIIILVRFFSLLSYKRKRIMIMHIAAAFLNFLQIMWQIMQHFLFLLGNAEEKHRKKLPYYRKMVKRETRRLYVLHLSQSVQKKIIMCV